MTFDRPENKIKAHVLEEVAALKAAAVPFQKYNVGPKEKRTYAGRVYDSIRECHRAIELDQLWLDGKVAWWLSQVSLDLTEDERYVIDFLVAVPAPVLIGREVLVHAEDVKGSETPRFRKIRKLWKKYGKWPLHVIKPKETEIIEGRK